MTSSSAAPEPPAVLWYVHHHGNGHAQRLAAVLPHLRSRVVAVSSRADLDLPRSERLTTHVLPRDDLPGRRGPGPFHHVPQSEQLAARAAALLGVTLEHGCRTAVVDISVEVAVLARLAGLRVALVRQSGRRSDAAHTLGFDAADLVIAPQHPDLEPVEQIDRLAYTGAFSRFDDRTTSSSEPVGSDEVRRRLGLRADERLVVMVVGGGGTDLVGHTWRGAPLPDGHHLVILGGAQRWCEGATRSLGRVADPFPWLVSADAVITSAGWATCHEAVAAGARTALVAERRPFAEQHTRVDALSAAGLVVPLAQWPTPAELPAVLQRVADLEPSAWRRYYDRRGARRFARVVDDLNRSALRAQRRSEIARTGDLEGVA